MHQPEYDNDDMQVVDSVTAIRSWPELYVGPPADPAALNVLLAESLCLAFDSATSGCATEVTIAMHDDGSASVCDNGPGLSVHAIVDGMTLIENLLTQIYACRNAKKNPSISTICHAGLVATNALSEWLTYETVQDGWLWRQQYLRGCATGPIAKLALCSQQRQEIAFRPDPAIFGTAKLSADGFIDWFKQQAFVFGTASVSLYCNQTSTRLWGAS